MKPYRPYRELSDSMLRVGIDVYSKPGMRWLFGGKLAELNQELLHRELPLIADESGGYLVEWILGVQ